MLHSKDTHSNLHVSERDVILQMEVENGIEDVPEIAKQFDKFAIRPLRELAKVKHASRFGMLFRLDECSATLSESPVQHFLQRDFDHVRAINLNFTRRLGVIEAIAKKRVNDYRKMIYTVRQDEDGAVRIAVDYQEYFDPSLDEKEWDARDFGRFIEQAIGYFNGEFTSWFNKLIRDQAA